MSAIGNYVHLTQEGVMNDPELNDGNSLGIMIHTRKIILERVKQNKKQVSVKTNVDMYIKGI